MREVTKGSWDFLGQRVLETSQAKPVKDPGLFPVDYFGKPQRGFPAEGRMPFPSCQPLHRHMAYGKGTLGDAFQGAGVYRSKEQGLRNQAELVSFRKPVCSSESREFITLLIGLLTG